VTSDGTAARLAKEPRDEMGFHYATLRLATTHHDQVLDITKEVAAVVAASGARFGQCTVYCPHATAAIAINENDDPNIGIDLMRALDKMVPLHDGWLHDRVDDNAASHIKSAIVGPSETIPIVEGKLALGTWQNVFLCEFDGPRGERRVIVTVVY
jgi:secondary thiamine-phosphate synthase enzyme